MEQNDLESTNLVSSRDFELDEVVRAVQLARQSEQSALDCIFLLPRMSLSEISALYLFAEIYKSDDVTIHVFDTVDDFLLSILKYNDVFEI